MIINGKNVSEHYIQHQSSPYKNINIMDEYKKKHDPFQQLVEIHKKRIISDLKTKTKAKTKKTVPRQMPPKIPKANQFTLEMESKQDIIKTQKLNQQKSRMIKKSLKMKADQLLFDQSKLVCHIFLFIFIFICS